MAPDQQAFWREESWNYFRRNYQGRNLAELEPNRFLESFVTRHRARIEADSILDFGCGSGSNLCWLKKLLRARRAVGIEASDKTVTALQEAFPGDEFLSADGRSLPFPANAFDLVVVRGVLMYVERDQVLQTLGELTRVCGQYLLLGEFSPSQPYSTIYRHQPEYRTYKMNYDSILAGSRLLLKLAEERFLESDPWEAVSIALYRKVGLEEAFPVRSREDFRRSDG